jgi:hypothetical protein
MYKKKNWVEIGVGLIITVNVLGQAGLGQNVNGLGSGRA